MRRLTLNGSDDHTHVARWRVISRYFTLSDRQAGNTTHLPPVQNPIHYVGWALNLVTAPVAVPLAD
jgi:hypothetical protein